MQDFDKAHEAVKDAQEGIENVAKYFKDMQAVLVAAEDAETYAEEFKSESGDLFVRVPMERWEALTKAVARAW